VKLFLRHHTSNWQLAKATPEGYDPLPINASAEGYKSKKTGKMTPIRQRKTSEKELRPLGHRSVELGFDFCFQQNVYGGWGRGLKDTGRGLQASPWSPESHVIARDRKGKGKTLPRINTDERGSGNRTWGCKNRRDRRHRTSSRVIGKGKPYRWLTLMIL